MLEDYKYGTRHSIRRVCRIKKSVEPVPQRTQSVAPPRSRLARQIRCRRHRRQESENAWRFGAGSRRAHDHFRDYTPTTVEVMTRRRNELLSDKLSRVTLSDVRDDPRVITVTVIQSYTELYTAQSYNSYVLPARWNL
jgi:hypothetical protein